MTPPPPPGFEPSFEKFPTRADIATALENLNQSLDLRFSNIHELLDVKVASLRKEGDIRFESSEKAILKQEAASEKRFENVNEFRAQMEDLQNTLMPRKEVETLFASITERVATLNDRMNRETGRGAGVAQLAGWIFGGVGVLVGMISIFVWLSSMQPRVERNTQAIEQQQGR